MATISPIILQQEGSRLRAAYQRVKRTRIITQTQVATACGWSAASTFNRILSGKIPLTYDSLLRLSEVLDFSPSAVSPRLVPDEVTGEEGRAPRRLPVSLVRAVTRGSWGEPFSTTDRLLCFTADSTAFALVFAPEVAPVGMDGWVLVIEPSRKVSDGDFVIIRHGAGKYSYGRVGVIADDGGVPVDIPGRGVVLAKPRQCMLVSTLCRKGELQGQ